MKTMRLLLLLLAATVLLVHALVGEDYDFYPSLPVVDTEEASDDAVSSNVNDQEIKSVSIRFPFRRIGKFVGIGTGIFVGYRALLVLGRLVKNMQESTESDSSPIMVENILEIRKEQEEIWNAILTIHNTQAEIRQELEVVRQSVDSNATATNETVREIESSVQSSIAQIAGRIDLMDEVLDEIEAKRKEESDYVNQKHLNDIANLREELSLLKQELPNMLKSHDEMFRSKLKTFKEDLVRIIVNKP